MGAFSERSGWYKLSILCLMCGFACLVFGVGYPSWADFDVFGISGLWQLCTKDLQTCKVYDIAEQDAWFEAVRGLEVLAIVLYLVTVGIAIRQSCCTPHSTSPDGNTLTALSFLTGTVAMSGVIVYGAQIHLGLSGSFSVSYWLAMFGAGAAIGAGFSLSVNRHSYRGSVIQPANIRQRGMGPPPYNRHPGVAQPSVIGGPMNPGYPPGPGSQPPGYTMAHGLSPGYPPREGYNQGYPGPPPSYSTLPGQTNSVGIWPAGNQGVPPPPAYSEEPIKY